MFNYRCCLLVEQEIKGEKEEKGRIQDTGDKANSKPNKANFKTSATPKGVEQRPDVR